ncbi:unnamed protein product [Spirodela intermedia]|uniref:Uncharacterized protein n=1 Tax=Spirodela intermedia TaxID=51605 RepID=A0A7I8J7Z1_SPIIN|nr:unnamed protein product [Spirodela intermedia]CAA6666170.1 unnamed protein product [Spirodela intermedia]
MAASNTITALVSLVALLCSIPVIGAGLWLATKHGSECVPLVRWPVVIMGIVLLLVSLAGFVGAYWRRQRLVAAYLLAMAALIVLLFVLLTFVFVVTRPDGSYAVPGRAFKEYRLAGFSPWLRDHIISSPHWSQIRRCVSASNVCTKLSQEQYFNPDHFFQADLSPLQSGCCKPPTACGTATPAADGDCYAWSNDQAQLCYGCGSCRAGLLGSLRSEWRKASIVLVATAVALLCVYVAACSAFRNAQTEDLHRRYKQGYV